jgi:hypothetical protein
MSRWKNGERMLAAMNRRSLLRERIETTRASTDVFVVQLTGYGNFWR